MTKLDQTKEKIANWHAGFLKAAILWSSGKDSTVLLHICRSMGLFFPVIFHRHPWMPKKNMFADGLIAMWDLEVYDWPPAQCGVHYNDTGIELVTEYQIGPTATLAIPMNTHEPEKGKPFICGRFDVLECPKGLFMHPWDLLFHGHKSSDVDPFVGPLPLKTDFIQPKDSPATAYPLKDWTDDDVWDYIADCDVPFQHNRYDQEHRRELEDKTYNPDCYPICTNCLNKRMGEQVFCPKINCMIPNISANVREFNFKFDYIDAIPRA